MASKAPEKLLTVAELVYLTGFAKAKVRRMLQDPSVWKVSGGTKLIEGDYRLPLCFYNRWVDDHDLALTPAKEVAQHA